MARQNSDDARIAGRYMVRRTLGRGGMAVVNEVLDIQTGKLLAVKQLIPKAESESWKDIVQLFEYEFYTLSQLAHPGVIEVFNFGKDNTQPYYTMELLDGDNLRRLAPLPWKKTCSLFIEVCSALCLLHSRRLVHRDISPRNIHRTREGKAKLIDFGAMMPMGPCKRAIGTPAYAPPEMVGLQNLDARADLFSLGATLYYVLTARCAYPANNFVDVRKIWRNKPPAPSSRIGDIPKALDELTLSLINIDLMTRPVNAAEVMERLGAIAGIELDEKLLVSQAYLTTPMLIAREHQLTSIRRSIRRAHRSRGGTLMIEGVAGTGRSRLVDVCVLEREVSGAIVLRADATDAYAGDWGAARFELVH